LCYNQIAGRIMHWIHVLWDADDDPIGNVQHIADNFLTKEDVEWLLEHPERRTKSRSSGRAMLFGHTQADEYVVVVYEEIDADTVRPVTAYFVEE
jgi:hypothetical protein